MRHAATARASAREAPIRSRREVENIDIARIFDEIGDLLEIQGENPFRIRAYRTAARTIQTLAVPAASLASEQRLDELPGIGSDLAEKVGTILETGTLPLLQELTGKTSEGLVAMLRIPGLGPKRAKLIYDTLGIETMDAVEAAAKSGRLGELRGIKETTARKILQGIADLRGHAGRWRLTEADAYLQPLMAHLKHSPAVKHIEVAGSHRRRKDTVGDIDILIVSSHRRTVVTRFVEYARVKQVQAEGPTRSSVTLDCGLQADLRVVPAVSLGSALSYFTGSKSHNIAVRALALKHGLKIIKAAADRGVALEINAQPERLDLDEVHARAAHEAGVRLVIGTDAHRVEEKNYRRYGIDQARRAWCEARHVLNTLPLAELRTALRR